MHEIQILILCHILINFYDCFLWSLEPVKHYFKDDFDYWKRLFVICWKIENERPGYSTKI